MSDDRQTQAAPRDVAARHDERLGTGVRDVRAAGGAAAPSRAIGAEAFTVGDQVLFREGAHSPHLTAHEAAHILQQRQARRMATPTTWSSKEPASPVEPCPCQAEELTPADPIGELAAPKIVPPPGDAEGGWPRPARAPNGEQGLLHRCEEGDTAASIAQKYGIDDWKQVWYHPANGGLRDASQDNPNRIPQGSVMFVPKSGNSAGPATTERHGRTSPGNPSS